MIFARFDRNHLWHIPTGGDTLLFCGQHLNSSWEFRQCPPEENPPNQGVCSTCLQQVNTRAVRKPSDSINPSHYKDHPSGVECITITEHFNFNVGNTIKYCWRAGLKGDAIEDLKKARWYLDREIDRLEKES